MSYFSASIGSFCEHLLTFTEFVVLPEKLMDVLVVLALAMKRKAHNDALEKWKNAVYEEVQGWEILNEWEIPNDSQELRQRPFLQPCSMPRQQSKQMPRSKQAA